jgi:hypothetical protein
MNASPRGIRGKPVKVEFRDLGTPTAERILKSGGAYSVGDDKQGTKVYRFQESPIDRMRQRDAICGADYAALKKYHHHWYHAKLAGNVSSMDLNSVFSSDKSTREGMATSEAACHHLKQYTAARALLGHRTGIVVDNIVCAEQSLEIAGYSIGWTNKPQAIAAATEMLRDAGYRLSRLWGIG